MPAHDPQVQDAANHAVKTIQQRSNSLLPYELQEVVHAKAEVSRLSTSYNLFLFLLNWDLGYELYCVMLQNFLYFYEIFIFICLYDDLPHLVKHAGRVVVLNSDSNP